MRYERVNAASWWLAFIYLFISTDWWPACKTQAWRSRSWKYNKLSQIVCGKTWIAVELVLCSLSVRWIFQFTLPARTYFSSSFHSPSIKGSFSVSIKLLMPRKQSILSRQRPLHCALPLTLLRRTALPLRFCELKGADLTGSRGRVVGSHILVLIKEKHSSRSGQDLIYRGKKKIKKSSVVDFVSFKSTGKDVFVF